MRQQITYKRKAVLVPYCLLAPGFQANAHLQRNYGWNIEFIKMLIEQEIDIIPYTCVEASFESLANGLLRNKHGLDYYQGIAVFNEYCEAKAIEETDRIMQMLNSGYHIIAILGIEHSPSCAVSYLYTHRGTQKRPGVFMNFLMENLTQNNVDIHYIGINKKYPGKAMKKLKESISDF